MADVLVSPTKASKLPRELGLFYRDGHSSRNSKTHDPRLDGGQCAMRAREFGLEMRARQLLQMRDAHHTAFLGGLLAGDRLHLGLLASLDPELDDLPRQARASLYQSDLLYQPLANKLTYCSSLGTLEPSFLEPLSPIKEESSREGADYASVADKSDGGSTLLEAFLAILKSTIGPAVLYMPKGFEEGGILFAVPMLLVSCCLVSWGALNILEAWDKERQSFAGLMGRAFGKAGVNIVRFVIVCQQCGICLTYFIFVATNSQEISMALFGIKPLLSTLCYVQLAFFIPLAMIRNIQNFAYTNLIANGLILYSLVVLCGFAASKVMAGPDANGGVVSSYASNDDENALIGTCDALKESPSRAPISNHFWFNANSFYLFVGTSAFMFEGVMALVVPLQEAVRDDLKAHFPRLFVRTLVGIVAVYMMIALLNFTAYSDCTQTVLTVNLSAGFWKQSVQLAFTVAVIFTFPLQLFPAIQIFRFMIMSKLWSPAEHPGEAPEIPSHERNDGPPPSRDLMAAFNEEPESEKKRVDKGALVAATDAKTHASFQKRMFTNSGRALLVVSLCELSIYGVDQLARIVSLLGAFLGIPLAFIFPSLIHSRIVLESPSYVKRINMLVVILGTLLCFACSGITIATWGATSA